MLHVLERVPGELCKLSQNRNPTSIQEGFVLFFFFFNLFCLPHLTWEGLGADGFSDVSLCGQEKEEASIAGTIPGRQAASVGAEVSGRAC